MSSLVLKSRFNSMNFMLFFLLQAPERNATVMARLVKKGIVSLDLIKSLADKFRQYNLAELDYNPPEVINPIFDRFNTKLISECA